MLAAYSSAQLLSDEGEDKGKKKTEGKIEMSFIYFKGWLKTVQVLQHWVFLCIP